MNAIKGTIMNGQVVADVPTSWPNGCQVVIEPVGTGDTDVEDDDGPSTPERIAERLALMDRIEPLEMSPEEVADWEAARKERKETDKATFEKRSEQLKRMWE